MPLEGKGRIWNFAHEAWNLRVHGSLNLLKKLWRKTNRRFCCRHHTVHHVRRMPTFWKNQRLWSLFQAIKGQIVWQVLEISLAKKNSWVLWIRIQIAFHPHDCHWSEGETNDSTDSFTSMGKATALYSWRNQGWVYQKKIIFGPNSRSEIQSRELRK